MAQADTGSSAPSLGISQLKVTSGSGQFITLYNLTNVAQDLSTYQLEYFNHYDAAKATSSKLIALSGILPPHSYYIVNDSTMTMCYQATVTSASLGLSSTAGMVELISFSQTVPGGLLQPEVQDYIGWSKVAASGAQTLPAAADAFLVRQPLDSDHNPQIMQPGTGSWLIVHPDANNSCHLVSGDSQSIQAGLSQLLPPQEPPATILNLNNGAPMSQAPSIPEADRGLITPRITELLPNPSGTGNDGSDEYIELYNSNATSFDLSGFKLQTGIASTHSYTFPAGSNLAAKSFKAFYSSETRLSLSNASGRAGLIDPLDNTIDQTETYGSANDGQSWALASGKWYWTINPTPGAANIIKQTAASKSTAKSKSTSVATKTKSAATKKLANTASTSSSVVSLTPIRPWVLALIGVIALIYGAYEYRHDLANRIHQLRGYLPPGRTGRPKAKRRRSN